jgi:hypothetical protein
MYTLVKKELLEYRNSLVFTPIIIALVVTGVMFMSAMLADRISVMGEVMMDVLKEQAANGEMSISIQIDGDTDDVIYEYEISEQTEPVTDEDWNFSREWNFNPSRTPDSTDLPDSGASRASLNPIFNLVHNFMLLVLVGVTINYLLGSLFNDRKDRSILFWKSMPVSEWEEVGARLLVALAVAPAVYIAVSVLTQLVTLLLSMLLVYRMDMDPYQVILGKVDFVGLLVNQVAGWVVAALWLAPVYAWLLLASAGARRSPFMLAVAPVIGLFLLEEIFVGTGYISRAVASHLPHYVSGGSAVGFSFEGLEWFPIDFSGLGLGLLFAAGALWLTVWLRRYRFEL